MTYEGVTLDCGLKVKNGKIVTEAKIDYDAIKKRIQRLTLDHSSDYCKAQGS